MNFLDTYINVISVLGMIVALEGIVFQLRSFEKQIKLQNFTEYTKRYHEIILNLPEEILSGESGISDLDNASLVKACSHIRAYYNLTSEEFYLKNKKMVDDDAWEQWETGMKATLTKKAFKEYWENIKNEEYFSTEFEKFISGIIKGAEKRNSP